MPSFIDPAGSRLLSAFRADVLHGAPLPCTAIHPDDFMLRFFLQQHHGHWEGALVDYFRSGLSASRTYERLLHWWFGASLGELRLLDFASGFGRVTRYLVQHVQSRRLWVSDIFPAAVEFQQRTFGVHGFPSAARPEELVCDETFDCVIASSLFSHLPAESFEPWLRRLFALLRPGGLLLLSVHDRSLRASAGVEAAVDGHEDGIHFEPLSEIPELAAERYGTSWVDEPFVRRAVAAATGGAPCVRLPRGLWSFQDLYAVGRERVLEQPPEVAEPFGYLEGVHRSPNGRWLTVHGWARDSRGPAIGRVELRVDGDLVAACEVGLDRPDVAAFFADGEGRVGWALSITGPSGGAISGEAMLSITAVGADGARLVFHLGSVEGTELALRLGDETRRRSELAETLKAPLAREIERMRASRFWKLRDAWWSLKAKVSITP